MLWCNVDFNTRSDVKYWGKFQLTSRVDRQNLDLKDRKIVELK